MSGQTETKDKNEQWREALSGNFEQTHPYTHQLLDDLTDLTKAYGNSPSFVTDLPHYQVRKNNDRRAAEELTRRILKIAFSGALPEIREDEDVLEEYDVVVDGQKTHLYETRGVVIRKQGDNNGSFSVARFNLGEDDAIVPESFQFYKATPDQVEQHLEDLIEQFEDDLAFNPD